MSDSGSIFYTEKDGSLRNVLPTVVFRRAREPALRSATIHSKYTWTLREFTTIYRKRKIASSLALKILVESFFILVEFPKVLGVVLSKLDCPSSPIMNNPLWTRGNKKFRVRNFCKKGEFSHTICATPIQFSDTSFLKCRPKSAIENFPVGGEDFYGMLLTSYLEYTLGYSLA